MRLESNVTVLLTTTEPQALRHDMYIGNLAQVEVCKDARAVGSHTSDPEVNVLNSEVVDPMSKMLQSLPPELNDEQRKAVADLLYKYDDGYFEG